MHGIHDQSFSNTKLTSTISPFPALSDFITYITISLSLGRCDLTFWMC